jgi:hypothetical protein
LPVGLETKMKIPVRAVLDQKALVV